jgi:hypothetical protein
LAAALIPRDDYGACQTREGGQHNSHHETEPEVSVVSIRMVLVSGASASRSFALSRFFARGRRKVRHFCVIRASGWRKRPVQSPRVRGLQAPYGGSIPPAASL